MTAGQRLIMARTDEARRDAQGARLPEPDAPEGGQHPVVRSVAWVLALRRFFRVRRQVLLRVLAFLFVVALSALIFIYSDQLVRLGAYGYSGLFLLNLLASATLILPAPGIALAFAAGASLNPLLVGLAVGAGSALGELTGYLAGFSGRGIVESDPQYERVHRWMVTRGLWVIFILSIVPNPLFDVAGITAGAMRMPVWKFLAAALPGKVIKATLLALAGAGMMETLSPMIERLLMR
jgi:membrane protein DedA with SNARE-associated domain